MIGKNIVAKKSVVMLWLIVIVYVVCIDLKGVWTDEGYRFILMSGGKTWQEYTQTGFGSFSDVLNAVGPRQYHPLFYLLDNAVVRVAHSHSDVLLRLLNLLWLVFGAMGLLRFFRKYSELTRLFGLTVFALNGYMLMNVMQIREYPVYVALMFWASALCLEILEIPEDSPWREWWPRLIAYGIVAALFFYAHPYSVFGLAAQALMFLTRKQDRRLFLRRLMLSYGIAAALVLPWLTMLYIRFPNRLNPGVWDTRTPSVSLLFSSLIGGFQCLLGYGLWSGQPFVQAVVVLILIGIPASWFLARKMGEAMDRRVAYALVTIALYGLFQVSYFFKQVLSIWPRYFIAYYVGYTLLTTGAFATLERYAQRRGSAVWKLVPAGMFLLMCFAGMNQVKLYRNDPYLDTGMTATCNWRMAASAMAQNIPATDTIVYYHPLLAWTIGLTNPAYKKEMSFAQIQSGGVPSISSMWVFDTPYVEEDLARTLARLDSLGYTKRRTVELGLGCNWRLMQYEVDPDRYHGSTLAEPPPGNAIVVQADSSHVGTAVIDRMIWGVGIPVVTSPKFPAWVEYETHVPAAGRYEVRVRCASEAPRPVKLSMSGRQLTDQLCGLPTGGYFPPNQRWQTSGKFEFPKGDVSLRLESTLPFPHISAIALIPAEPRK